MYARPRPRFGTRSTRAPPASASSGVSSVELSTIRISPTTPAAARPSWHHATKSLTVSSSLSAGITIDSSGSSDVVARGRSSVISRVGGEACRSSRALRLTPGGARRSASPAGEPISKKRSCDLVAREPTLEAQARGTSSARSLDLAARARRATHRVAADDREAVVDVVHARSGRIGHALVVAHDPAARRTARC